MKTRWIMLCLMLSVLGSGMAAAESALQPVTLRLHWLPNAEFGGILLAKARGWYAEAGLDLQIMNMDFEVSSVDDVVAGKADIGVAEGDVLIKARADGKPVKAFAASFQKSPFCLISKKGSGITTPSDLRGKRVAITVPEVVPILKIILKNQNLTLEDIDMVETGINLQAFIDDQVDVYPGFMSDEPFFAKALGVDVEIIPAFKYGYDFYSGVYFATEAVLEERSEALRTFLDVTLRGWQAAYRDPAAAAQVIVEQFYPQGTVQQQTESLKVFRMLATFGMSEPSIGFMEARFWARGIEALREHGQIEQQVVPSALFTLELLKKS